MTYSYSSGIAPTLPIESFLQRRALENVVPELGYMDDAQVIEQPANGGKHAKFFRYTELPAALEILCILRRVPGAEHPRARRSERRLV